MDINHALLQGIYGFAVTCGYLMAFGAVMLVIGLIASLFGKVFGTDDEEDDDE